MLWLVQTNGNNTTFSKLVFIICLSGNNTEDDINLLTRETPLNYIQPVPVVKTEDGGAGCGDNLETWDDPISRNGIID